MGRDAVRASVFMEFLIAFKLFLVISRKAGVLKGFANWVIPT
jgi:hypothetical protein